MILYQSKFKDSIFVRSSDKVIYQTQTAYSFASQYLG